jgi:hypothetical protein
VTLTSAEVHAIYYSIPEAKEFRLFSTFARYAFSVDMQEECAWLVAREAADPEEPTEEQMLEEWAALRRQLARVWRAVRRAGLARWQVYEAADDLPEREVLRARRALEKRGVLPREVRLVT